LAKHYEVYIGAYSYGGCFRPGAFPPRSYVGRYSSLAAGIRSIERNHPYDRPSTSSFFYDPGLGVVDSDTLPEYEPLVIGHDVWIGWNAILLPGCRQIGTGCIIGAGAVVTRDAPAYSIVAGTPGRVLKYRFDEEIREDLLKTGWWRLEPSELSGLQSSFTQSLNAETKKNFPLSILASNES
jgi:acetyltransferase-like isoleucine patch superfamily enzyme